ncbi:MAG TPA: DUF882 domain-containing protein [Methylocella sp.]|nr:DUF882 domain-containing protein [Methylocella sp.]
MFKEHRSARLQKLRPVGAALASALLISCVLCALPSSTETAIANGDTRTLNLYHTHTGESIQATFRVNGALDPGALERLNYFLRDWRNNDRTRMDPRLFDVIWEVYRTAGATEPIRIVSAYRSPQTNAMLRARSHAVAEHSQHILGRAMDTTMPGTSMERIREIGMRLQRGGVGWYPGENFVHLDVGNVRAWPRMSYDQLVRLFPDGKTVHLAADGRALPRYQEARAEIAARGGVISDVPQYASAGGLFAWLFGKRGDDGNSAGDALPGKPPAATRMASGGAQLAESRVASDKATSTPPAPSSRPTPAPTVVAAIAPEKSSQHNEAAPGIANGMRLASFGTEDDGIEPVHKNPALAAAPMPPNRPALPSEKGLDIAFVNAPEPPARPAGLTHLARLDPAQASAEGTGDNAGATSTDAPLDRAANLPVVITKGPKDYGRIPSQVLAFAADIPDADRSIALSRTPAQGASLQGGQLTPAIRPGRAKSKNQGDSFENIKLIVPPSILGPSFTGLRRAARIDREALSHQPAGDYLAAFRESATDLDPHHFVAASADARVQAEKTTGERVAAPWDDDRPQGP